MDEQPNRINVNIEQILRTFYLLRCTKIRIENCYVQRNKKGQGRNVTAKWLEENVTNQEIQ